jgi:hypothetical protein
MARRETKPAERGRAASKSAGPASIPTRPRSEDASPLVAVATIVLLTLEAWFLVYSMIRLWPTQEPQIAGAASTMSTASILWWEFAVSAEGRLFILVLFAGAFGGAVMAVRDLAIGVKKGGLPLRSIGWYIMRPLVASGLGLGFYLVIRGGFFSPQAGVQETSPYSFVGLAVLVGLFTDQAVAKLAEIADAVFSRSERE